MIVLETLDLEARRAGFRTISGTRREARDALRRLQPLLARLGVVRAGLDFDGAGCPDSEDESGAARASSASVPSDAGSPHLAHRFELLDGVPTCVARFPHRRDSLETIAAYTNLVLATRGPLHGDLNLLHLALYELCANVLDHGRPLAPGVEIELGLSLGDRAVTGWLRDRCESFDPRLADLPALAEHAMHRSRRGYGLHMVLGILGSLSHDFDGTGNRLTFRKEIAS